MARPPRDTPAAHPDWPALTFPLHYRRDWQPPVCTRDDENGGAGSRRGDAAWRRPGGERWPLPGPQLPQATRPMRNRGPRGYVRPDARIEEEVFQALRAEGEHFDDVHVVSSNGHVRLSGSVPLRRHRYLAEDIAAELPFVTGVQNDIDVER